jgi:hypothetical protein
MKQLVAVSASAVSPCVVGSGSASSLIDRNSGTSVTFNSTGGSGSPANVNFWFMIDMGYATRITQAILRSWGGTGDTAFYIRYSNSPLTTLNSGTIFGTEMTSTVLPATQTSTQTGDATARYWGLQRSGLFENQNVSCAEFELYAPDQGGGVIL